MSKLLNTLTFLVAFLATSIAFAGPAKLVECATSNGKIRYEGIETLAEQNGATSLKYDGQFFLAAPRSDRNYVMGDFMREGIEIDETAFLSRANVLVVDATECNRDSQSASQCTLVNRATVTMLCSYIFERQ